MRIVVGVVMAGGCEARPGEESGGAARWEYETEGEPERWGELDPHNAACREGQYQSPIDLHAVALQLARPLTLDYHPDRLRIVNDGHTVVVEHEGGSTLRIDDRVYTLAQYHVHSPSEHTIEGRHAALELHFVHTHPSGDLAVLGVLVEEGAEEGAEAQAIAEVWGHLPTHEGETFVGEARVNPLALLPASLEHYQYHGSLTTPPCSETVDWSVMVQPLRMSAAHIEAFRRLYRANARPIQPRADWCMIPEQAALAGG